MPGRWIPCSASIVGVQKAATSTLHSLITEHPAVAGARPKEHHFFDDESVDWDAPDYSAYGKQGRRPRERLAIDSTPSYLYWPPALARMRRYDPTMRLIACFRDPIERAFSAWSMDYGRRDDWSQLRVAIDRGMADVIGPEEAWERREVPRTSLVARGLYHHQLVRGLEQFDRDQWLLLSIDEVDADALAASRRIAVFLGLRPLVPDVEERRKWRSPTDLDASPVTADDVEVLASAYAEDLPHFEALSGIDVSGWSTSRVLTGTLAPADLAERLNAKVGLTVR